MRNIHRPLYILSEITLKLDGKSTIFFLMYNGIEHLFGKK
jgi:hypothetical protein